MQDSKYYNHINNRALNLEIDGCDLAEWTKPNGQHIFAKHPDGFRIFLPQDKLATSDEYGESDPYSVEKNIESEFHKRRIELTIDLVREVTSLTRDTPQILDIGCGQGHITERIRQSLEGAKLTGLDYSVSAVEYAHKHFPQIDFSVGDAYDSPYSKGFFDVVVCNNLWEHVPDPLFLLSRIKRSIKPDGYLIVSTPSRYRIGNLIRILRGKPVDFMSQHHVTEYTIGQVKEQLAYGGFEVIKVLSREISARSLKAKLGQWMLSKFISRISSHHKLESTVFYLAQKTTRITEQNVVLDKDSTTLQPR